MENDEKIKFHILARGLIIKGNSVLLAYSKGSTNTFLPGGHIEPGERAEHTLIRELKEELGINITVQRYLGTIEQTFTENGIQHHGINLFFLMNSNDVPDELFSREDHLDFFWADAGETGKMNLMPEDLQTLIKNFINGNNEIWWHSDFR